ncbi:hypothetical protein BD414DRAFT_479801 [Trametes punicea]|nr:hypothetical protein BD414DRAFT_479801 [Trametes punicea]
MMPRSCKDANDNGQGRPASSSPAKMDAVADDQDLTKELMKLLHEKLREARQELRTLQSQRMHDSEMVLVDSTELQHENEQLREELSSLQLRLSAAADNEDVKNCLLMGYVNEGSEALQVEKQLQALQEQENVEDARVQGLGSQLTRRKEKYRRLKAETACLQESLSLTQEAIALEDKEIANCKALALDAKSSLREMKHRELERLNTATFLSSAGVRSFDGPAAASLEPCLRSVPFSRLPSNILKEFGPLALLVLSSEEAVWSQDGISRALYVARPFTYNPVAQESGGQWNSNRVASGLQDDIGGSQELIFRRNGDWYYYGTYRCLASSSIAASDVEQALASVVRKIVGGTVLQKDHLAPLAVKFLESMYVNGPLSLHGFALERTGFHHELYEALLSSRKKIQQINSSPTLTKGVVGKGTKKKRNHAQSEVPIPAAPPLKKRKGSQ